MPLTDVEKAGVEKFFDDLNGRWTKHIKDLDEERRVLKITQDVEKSEVCQRNLDMNYAKRIMLDRCSADLGQLFHKIIQGLEPVKLP